MELEQLEDGRLDEIFALEVCGLSEIERLRFGASHTHNFNLVLPYLEKAGWRGTSNRVGSTSAATVSVLVHASNWDFAEPVTAQSSDRPNDLARAAVIALILAARKNSHG